VVVVVVVEASCLSFRSGLFAGESECGEIKNCGLKSGGLRLA